MKLEYLVLRKYHTLLLLIILVISLLYCTSVLTPCFPSDYTVPAESGGGGGGSKGGLGKQGQGWLSFAAVECPCRKCVIAGDAP